MKSLIIVLGGVIWALLGLYLRSRKKESKEKSFEKRPLISTWEEMIQKMQGAEIEPYEEMVNENESLAQEELPNLKQEHATEEKLLCMNEEETIGSNITEKEEMAFDLRQAIIYNEIINKKYI